MVVLENDEDNFINVSKMKDGDIAIIRNWLIYSFKGAIVQRYGNDLITLGSPRVNGWKNYFNEDLAITDNLVEILKPGTHLVIK